MGAECWQKKSGSRSRGDASGSGAWGHPHGLARDLKQGSGDVLAIGLATCLFAGFARGSGDGSGDVSFGWNRRLRMDAV